MTHSKRTVIFWGAGATAAVGMQTTVEQAEALRKLALGQEGQNPLAQRIREALAGKAEGPWAAALHDLLTILGDGDETEEAASAFTVTRDQMQAMRRNWRDGADDDEIRNRIVTLRTWYDWPALKAVINVCPGVQEDSDGFQLNDLFNVLDMHGQSGQGFRVQEGEFLTPQRVLGARNALKMLLQTMLYIGWHYGREANREVLERHYDFAVALGRRMQQQGLELAERSTRFDSRHFYMGDVSFVSLNYDPIAIWCQFVANRNLNKSANVPHIGYPASKLQIFHDLGHFVGGSRVEDKEDLDDTPWHPMNETAAQRLNDPDHRSGDRIRISKFLFPHGCLWWRECPDCGKLSSYMGDAWEWDSPTLIPPPPLKAFVPDELDERNKGFLPRFCKEGEVDARGCVHCQTLTYAHHTQTIMQSSFKEPPPPFLDEIKRDLRVAVQNAGHIVLMGYSLPPDDVDYRAFFAARRRPNPENPENPVKCSVVVGRGNGHHWRGPSEWPAMLRDMDEGKPPRTTLEAARDLFGERNVRFYGGGIPNVFLDGGGVTASAVDKLLTWTD